VVYHFMRPKKHYRTGKHAGELRSDAPPYYKKNPDQDKLDRAVFDALTGFVYRDDCQVVGGFRDKVWIPIDDERGEGALIGIEVLEEIEE